MSTADRVEPPPTARQRASYAAAALLWLQVVIIAAFVVFFVVEFAQGQAQDPAAVLTSVLVFVVGAVGLSILARAWMSGRTWQRTPTVVWNALLLPIGWSLLETHHGFIAAGVLATGVVGIAAAVLSVHREGSRG